MSFVDLMSLFNVYKKQKSPPHLCNSFACKSGLMYTNTLQLKQSNNVLISLQFDQFLNDLLQCNSGSAALTTGIVFIDTGSHLIYSFSTSNFFEPGLLIS